MDTLKSTMASLSSALGGRRGTFEVGDAEKGAAAGDGTRTWRTWAVPTLGLFGVATVAGLATYVGISLHHAAGGAPQPPGPPARPGRLALGLRCPGPGPVPAWRIGLFEDLDRGPRGCADLATAAPPLDEATFAGGRLFAYDGEGAQVARCGLDAAGGLACGSPLALGIARRGAEPPTVRTLHVNASFAVTLADPQRTLGTAIVGWDPAAMALGQTASGASLYTNDPYHGVAEWGAPVRFGDAMALPLSRTNPGRSKIQRDTTVVLLDLRNLAAAPKLVRDTRCLGASSLAIDAAGDLYVTATANAGWYLRSGEYTPTSAQRSACLLRIRQGTTAFDPGYLVDLDQVLGTSGVAATFAAGDGRLVALALQNFDLRDPALQITRERWQADALYAWTTISTAGLQAPAAGAPAATHNVTGEALTLDGALVVQSRGDGDAGVTLYRVATDGSFRRGPTLAEAGPVAALGWLLPPETAG